MKLNKKSLYALTIIKACAAAKGSYISLNTISSEYNLSIFYLEQIGRLLRIGDILEVKKGPNGGHRMIKDPSTISVYEIMMAINVNVDFEEYDHLPFIQRLNEKIGEFTSNVKACDL